jgi:hypothetical protein
MRKHQWLRKSKVNYSNYVRDLDETTADLASRGFLDTRITDLSEALAILSKEELKSIAKERNLQISIEYSVSLILNDAI